MPSLGADHRSGLPASSGNRGLFRSRYAQAGLLLAALTSGWVAWSTLSAWTTRRELGRADTLLRLGRHEQAAALYQQLTLRRPGLSAGWYGLGLCHERAGRIDAALAAWGRVPESAPEFERAMQRRARLGIEHGRFADAEDALQRSWERDGRQAGEAYERLGWLLQVQGRHDDVRRLIEATGDTSPHALRTLVQIEARPVPVESLRATIERAAAACPEDDRVWLGRANLATRLNDLDEADAWLVRCEQRRPGDPAVARARLAWALAAGRTDAAAQALRHLPAAEFTPGELAELRAWFATLHGNPLARRTALRDRIQQDPAAIGALEQLAGLASREGRAPEAIELRRRKAGLDADRAAYVHLVLDDDPLKQPVEAARLARNLGRTFEAQGWTRIAGGARGGGPRSPRPEATRTPLFGSTGPSVADALGSAIASPAPSTPRAEVARSPIRFTDDAEAAGLRFTFDGGRSALRQLPETMSGGVALLDYDGDGWLDIYCVQGGAFPPEADGTSGDRLFRNRGDGTFEDATQSAHIAALARGYGHGAAVGDIDNDGLPDLFLTRWRGYQLLRNQGDGTFADVTGSAALDGPRGWPTSAAFADLDADGDLDLYVCHYLEWDSEAPRVCRREGTGEPFYCTPIDFPAEGDRVYRNDQGRFVDVTRTWGLAAADPDGRGLGVLAARLGGERSINLFVANDMTANLLLRPAPGPVLEDRAQETGASANAEGGYQAGMGVAAGDLDGDGLPELAVTNFYGEGTTVYRGLPGGWFSDASSRMGVAAATRYRLGFGLVCADLDNDGWPDLVQANGHVNDLQGEYPYAMPIQCLRNNGTGRLVDVSNTAGEPFRVGHVGRGLAAGDLDNDGRVDLVLAAQNEPMVYLRNRTEEAGHWVVLALEATAGQCDAIGAVVAVTAGGRRRVGQRVGGGSYLSASDPRLHFGLGDQGTIVAVEVEWPSGRVDRWEGLAADQGYALREADPMARPLLGYGAAR
jgi:tetratricopeptide (TPR) repeat protein